MAHREELALNEALLVVLIELSCATLSRGKLAKSKAGEHPSSNCPPAAAGLVWWCEVLNDFTPLLPATTTSISRLLSETSNFNSSRKIVESFQSLLLSLDLSFPTTTNYSLSVTSESNQMLPIFLDI